MMKIIAVANQKGGIGKTTTALALVAGLRRKGKNVLLIDLDPQTNATFNYCAQIDGVGTAYDLLVNGDTDCIQSTEMGDIIAGDPQLKDAAQLLTGVKAPYRLRKGLETIAPNYDFVVLDTPPALSVLLTNALTAADTVVIPLTSDAFGLQGLVLLNETIKDIKEITNPSLNVAGLLLTMYHGNTTLAKAVNEALPDYAALFGTKIFKAKIRESVNTRKAQAVRNGLFAFAPYSTTARDYNSFINELLTEEKIDG